MSWLERLFSSDSSKQPVQAGAALGTPGSHAQPLEAVTGIRLPPEGFGARQPLVSASGSVAGFEFELPICSRIYQERVEAGAAAAAAEAEAVAVGARAIALVKAMRLTLESGRAALATLPVSVLARPTVIEQMARETMIVLADEDWDDPAKRHEHRLVIDRARAHGVRIGLPAARAGAGVPFDFVVARGTDGINTVMVLAQKCRLATPPIMLVATGLASIDEVELALKAGASLASGNIDAMGAEPAKRALQPAVQRVCQVLRDLSTDADTSQIAQNLRADAAVSYRLLRYVNSSALGLRRSIDSIEQAVLLLGRKELYRWLSVLMLAIGDGRKASRALQELSLARARLLELLASDQGRNPPDALFTVGLLSLMDVMMQMPLADALQPLRLGPAARQALLEGSGPWHEYLAMAIDLEQADLGPAARRAKMFGDLDHVLERADQAWQWAATVQTAGNS